MAAGESAELSMILRGGKKYRILVKGSFSDMEIQIYDRLHTLVYDNTKHDMAQLWDFNIKATQEYHIVVTAPFDDGYSDGASRGCVALAVGFLDND